MVMLSHADEALEQEALAYLREKQVHKLFERMVKRLLTTKPDNIYKELVAMLSPPDAPGEGGIGPRRASYDDTAALGDTAKTLDSTFTKSLDSTTRSLAPQPGEKGGSQTRKRAGGGPKSKRVQFKESEELFEITDVNVRIERGDFWRDGELEQLKQNQEQTNECYFCCYDPNDCEWSLFSLYEEPINGDWYLVCPNEDCLAKVKPWWSFSYFMGDSLSRCDLETVKNILSYLEPRERRRMTAIAAIWQEAEWEVLRSSNGDTARLLADVDTFSFSTLTKDLCVRNLPPNALHGRALANFAQKLCNESLVSLTLVDSNLSVGTYRAILSEDLVLPLTALMIGPLVCTTADDEAAIREIIQRLVARGDDHQLAFTVAGADATARGLLETLRPTLQASVKMAVQ